jgi:hypothetical protein
MTKNELLEALQEALKTEESAMPLYTRHIESTLFLSDFNADEQKQIGQILHVLNAESSRHRESLLQLISKVESEDKNVY